MGGEEQAQATASGYQTKSVPAQIAFHLRINAEGRQDEMIDRLLEALEQPDPNRCQEETNGTGTRAATDSPQR